MRRLPIMIISLLAAVAVAGDAAAQRMPERSLVRRGNRQFDKMNFDRAIGFYGQALAADSTSFEAGYNLGNALFRAERFENAEQMLARMAADTTRTDAERAEAFYNLGDVQFRQQNLQAALESFKNSLRLNPSDMEAKYNYAYTKKLLEQQQDQNGGGDNNDQNNQNNQNDQNNQNNQNNQDNQQPNDDRNNDNSDPNGDNDRNDDNGQPDRGQGDGQEQPGDGKPQPGGISPEQLEAMLDAIQAQEDKTQDKVNEKKGVIVRGNKNW